MDYDVLILGGGIIGCAAAYELSKYSLNIALIEKDYDIADDVALINSSIVYDGVECEDNLMCKLEIMGNYMMNEITKKFNVPFERKDSLTIFESDYQSKKIQYIYERAKKRGIKDIYMLDKNSIGDIEPNLNINVKNALYSKNKGVICPYDLAIAYGEVAFDNGVNFKLEEEVLDIQKISKGFRVITNKNKFTCNMVLNTIPGDIYTVNSPLEKSIEKNNKKLNFMLFKKGAFNSSGNIINIINDNEEIQYSNTIQGDILLALKSNRSFQYEETLSKSKLLFNQVDHKKVSAFYHWSYYENKIIIDDSLIDKGYIKVTGKHYGQVTMTPAIAKIACETIVSNLNCMLKKDFVDKRREIYRFRELSNNEKIDLINMDKKYGKIICNCKHVTEGEIIDAIRRPLGARTIEGIKRRTGAILGDCQGSYCLDKIISILARETNKNISDIVKDSKNSNILSVRIKQFNSM